MRIGIDIDDTINETWKHMIPSYSQIFHKDEATLKKSLPYHRSIADLNISIDDYFKTMRPYYEKNVLKVTLKPHAKEVINELYDRGHTIIFITARGKLYANPDEITKKYLANHGIKYHKLITRASKKDLACLTERIDLFIDDSIKHCESVSKTGIKILMPDNYFNHEITEYKHFTDWREVLDYVTKEENRNRWITWKEIEF